MIIYILCILIGTILGGVIIHLLDVRYIQSLINSFDKAQATYIRGMEALRTENTRLHNIVNSYQINNVEKSR